MSDWPYQHRAGHLKARIVEETAETVVIQYQGIDDPKWALACTTLPKADFLNLYSPEQPAAGEEK